MTDNVRQLRPTLTMKAMDEASWEPALSYILPENPDIELLDRARADVLIYLDFVTHDAAQFEDVRAQIMRAASRLIEIAEHWPTAMDDHVKAGLEADYAKREGEWREWRARQHLKLVPNP
jgi:hypothetical protein